MYESSLFRRQNRFCSSQLIESINSGEFVERATQSFDFTCDKQEKNALVSRFLYFTQAHSIISFSDFKGKTENWGNSNGIWSGECENSSAARMALWEKGKSSTFVRHVMRDLKNQLFERGNEALWLLEGLFNESQGKWIFFHALELLFWNFFSIEKHWRSCTLFTGTALSHEMHVNTLPSSKHETKAVVPSFFTLFTVNCRSQEKSREDFLKQIKLISNLQSLFLN